jgi:acylphosphatase
VRSHVLVTGRVQNVTFRDATRREAERQGVGGWVRNLTDGSVEAELEGRQAAVDAVVVWMGDGPALAKVEDITVTSVAPTGETIFSVR